MKPPRLDRNRFNIGCHAFGAKPGLARHKSVIPPAQPGFRGRAGSGQSMTLPAGRESLAPKLATARCPGRFFVDIALGAAEDGSGSSPRLAPAGSAACA